MARETYDLSESFSNARIQCHDGDNVSVLEVIKRHEMSLTSIKYIFNIFREGAISTVNHTTLRIM